MTGKLLSAVFLFALAAMSIPVLILTEDPNTNAASFSGNIHRGEQAYDKYCSACHNTGLAGSPKLNDRERWEQIGSKPMDELKQFVKSNFEEENGKMRPKINCTNCRDEDFENAIAFMIKTAGVKA